MSSLALLVFTRNDGDRAAPLISQLASTFDETVVVDSSDPGPSAEWTSALPEGTRVYRVLPVGYVDVLRPYGVQKIRSDRVLILDSDEAVSPKLFRALRGLVDRDGYVVPRRERALGAYTYHLRLFRPRLVRYGPRSWEYPSIDGSVGALPHELCLDHDAPYAQYLARDDRARRYLMVESVERPFTREYASAFFRGDRRRADPANRDVPLDAPMIQLLLRLEFLRDLLTSGSLRLARFRFEYGRARAQYFDRLSAEERLRRTVLHAEIRTAGGMYRYLGFDDPDYLDRLSSTFGWDRDGPRVLEELIRYRHSHGRPRASFDR